MYLKGTVLVSLVEVLPVFFSLGNKLYFNRCFFGSKIIGIWSRLIKMDLLVQCGGLECFYLQISDVVFFLYKHLEMQNQNVLVKPFFVWPSTEKNNSDAASRINKSTFIRKKKTPDNIFLAKTNWVTITLLSWPKHRLSTYLLITGLTHTRSGPDSMLCKMVANRNLKDSRE